MFIISFTYLYIYLFIYLLICSFVCLFIYLAIYIYIDFNQLDLNKKIEILFNNDDSQFLAIFSEHIFSCMKKRRNYISD